MVGTSPVTYLDDGVSVSIPLQNRAGVIVGQTFLDVADAEWASQWTWRLVASTYAGRGVGKDPLYLHRVLCGLTPGDGLEVDHRDRNRLNNRRVNLRITDTAGNHQNLPSYRTSTSSYRGVSWNSEEQKWRAQIKLNGKTKCLGQFRDELEAAEAARAARAKHMPLAID